MMIFVHSIEEYYIIFISINICLSQIIYLKLYTNFIKTSIFNFHLDPYLQSIFDPKIVFVSRLDPLFV